MINKLHTENSCSENFDDITFKIKSSISKLFDPMPDGDKQHMKDIVHFVIQDIGIQVSVANSLVPAIVRMLPGITVSPGRTGGVYKGARPVKVDTKPRCKECGQIDRKKLKDSQQALIAADDILDLDNE